MEVRRKRRRKLGPEPKVWDAVIDREEEESDDEDDEEYGEKEKSWKWKGKQRDEVASWSVSLRPDDGLTIATGCIYA